MRPAVDPQPTSASCRDPAFATVLQNAASSAADRVAIVGLSASLTYAALLARTRCIAWNVARAVPVGAAVASLVPHTPAGVAGLLGCLASGRTTIILNPAEPASRLAAILADARPAAVLAATDAALIAPGPGLPAPRLLALADMAGAAETFPPPLPADAPAVVHFTSGSTGQPKGIAFDLAAVLARIDDGTSYEATDRSIAVSLPHTSSGLCLLLGPLLAGGRALVANIAGDGATAVMKLMRAEAATCFSATPAMLRMLMRLPAAGAAMAAVRVLRAGGAGINGADIRAWRAMLPARCRVMHRYASTEAGVVTQWEVPADFGGDGAVPSGRAMTLRELEVVDTDGAPVAAGDAGELVVRGPHMALGEWRDGGLVAGRLPADPRRPGWRVFRTGDVVRIAADGMMTFSTRSDRQIKINGVRIEPAEIEAVLRRHPDVADAAIMARPGASSLVLHGFVASPGADPEPLRAALTALLRAALPATMRPATITVVAAFPMLPGGKTDLRALAAVHDPQGEGRPPP